MKRVGITELRMMIDTRTDFWGELGLCGKIREGDHVFILIDEKRRFLIRVRKGGILGTDRGFVKHDEVLGRHYGEYVNTSLGVKAHLLRPLPQDYLHGFKRVTQVIYPKDAAYMVYLSGIGPGSKVVEAGVGTGYLTSYLAHVVGNEGKVYGYEIREEFIRVALENLDKIGVRHRVVIKNADIRRGIDEHDVDAVFLDMPDPWNALSAAYEALKPSAPILIYVPSINQVIKTINAIKRLGKFIDITVSEVNTRTYVVDPEALRPHTIGVVHTGYIIFARKIINELNKP